MVSMRVLLPAILILAALLGGLLGAPAAGTSPVTYASSGASGGIVVHAHDATGVRFTTGASVPGGTYASLAYTAMTPNGSAFESIHLGYGTQTQNDGGYGYVGVGDLLVEVPPPTGPPTHNVATWSGRSYSTDETDVYLVILWDKYEPGMTFSLTVTWEPTTTVTVTTGNATTLTDRDLNGVRAGAAVAAGAHLAMPTSFPAAGRQIVGDLYHYRDDGANVGNFSLDYGGHHRAIEYNSLCVLEGWITFGQGRWRFTTDDDLTLSHQYAGREEETQIHLILGTFPAGTLPDDLWHEKFVPGNPADC